jgi:Bacterial Ig-like domain (group 3)/FG-GAP-like repeat
VGYSIYNIFGLSFGDVNGDGKLDIVSQSNSVPDGSSAAADQFNVMLNNEDGTFGTAKPLDTSALHIFWGAGVAFGDLNADGKEDLVLAYDAEDQGTSYLAAALGNGDGTFGTFFQLKLLTIGTQVQLTDFDGDGKLDAILSSGEVALGKGDGTFALPTSLFAPTASPQIRSLLQMPIYAHSSPSLVFLNLVSGSNAVFTPQDSSSASTSVALSAGTHTLTAQYSGDSTYAAGDSSPVTITVAPALTTTTVGSSANPSYVGESVTFTATTAGLGPGAGGAVTFSSGSTTLGTATVSNGSASYATTLSSVGNQIITAAYGGDANDGPSSGTVNQAVEAPVTVGSGVGGSTSLTVASGQSVTTPVSVSGAAGFSGTLNFSCTGLPANAACSFSPASVAVSGTTAATTTLTVSTAATTAASVGDAAPLRAMAVLACGLPLLGLLTLLPVARGRRLLLCLGFVLFVSVTSLTGCGGGRSAQSSGMQTAPGSYTFHVVATAGAVSSTATYSLTVQ